MSFFSRHRNNCLQFNVFLIFLGVVLLWGCKQYYAPISISPYWGAAEPHIPIMSYCAPLYQEVSGASRSPEGYRLIHFQDVSTVPYYGGTANIGKRKGRNENTAHIFKGNARPVLFLHGNSGHYKEGRGIGHGIAKALKERNLWSSDEDTGGSRLEFFTVDFLEEAVIHSGSLILKQALFANYSVSFLLKRYNEEFRMKQRIGTAPLLRGGMGMWVVGHSMGGIIARLLPLMSLSSATPSSCHIAGILTLSTPHFFPPIFMDNSMRDLYDILSFLWQGRKEKEGGPQRHCTPERMKRIQKCWVGFFEDSLPVPTFLTSSGKRKTQREETTPTASCPIISIPVISVSSGGLDALIYDQFTKTQHSFENSVDLATEEMYGVGLPMTHHSITWAQQLIYQLGRLLVDMHPQREGEGVVPIRQHPTILDMKSLQVVEKVTHDDDDILDADPSLDAELVCTSLPLEPLLELQTKNENEIVFRKVKDDDDSVVIALMSQHEYSQLVQQQNGALYLKMKQSEEPEESKWIRISKEGQKSVQEGKEGEKKMGRAQPIVKKLTTIRVPFLHGTDQHFHSIPLSRKTTDRLSGRETEWEHIKLIMKWELSVEALSRLSIFTKNGKKKETKEKEARSSERDSVVRFCWQKARDLHMNLESHRGVSLMLESSLRHYEFPIVPFHEIYRVHVELFSLEEEDREKEGAMHPLAASSPLKMDSRRGEEPGKALRYFPAVLVDCWIKGERVTSSSSSIPTVYADNHHQQHKYQVLFGPNDGRYQYDFSWKPNVLNDDDDNVEGSSVANKERSCRLTLFVHPMHTISDDHYREMGGSRDNFYFSLRVTSRSFLLRYFHELVQTMRLYTIVTWCSLFIVIHAFVIEWQILSAERRAIMIANAKSFSAFSSSAAAEKSSSSLPPQESFLAFVFIFFPRSNIKSSLSSIPSPLHGVNILFGAKYKYIPLFITTSLILLPSLLVTAEAKENNFFSPFSWINGATINHWPVELVNILSALVLQYFLVAWMYFCVRLLCLPYRLWSSSYIPSIFSGKGSATSSSTSSASLPPPWFHFSHAALIAFFLFRLMVSCVQVNYEVLEAHDANHLNDGERVAPSSSSGVIFSFLKFFHRMFFTYYDLSENLLFFTMAYIWMLALIARYMVKLERHHQRMAGSISTAGPHSNITTEIFDSIKKKFSFLLGFEEEEVCGEVRSATVNIALWVPLDVWLLLMQATILWHLSAPVFIVRNFVMTGGLKSHYASIGARMASCSVVLSLPLVSYLLDWGLEVLIKGGLCNSNSGGRMLCNGETNLLESSSSSCEEKGSTTSSPSANVCGDTSISLPPFSKSQKAQRFLVRGAIFLPLLFFPIGDIIQHPLDTHILRYIITVMMFSRLFTWGSSVLLFFYHQKTRGRHRCAVRHQRVE